MPCVIDPILGSGVIWRSSPSYRGWLMMGVPSVIEPVLRLAGFGLGIFG